MMMHNRREIFFSFGLLVSALLVGAGLIEVGVRLFAAQMYEVHPNGLWQLSKTLGCRMTPGFDGTHVTPEFRVRVRISEQGLRDRAYGPKRPGRFRVLALGDSFTFGFGVDAEDAYPKQLERLLRANRRGAEYDVINAGTPGYATNQELQYLKKDGLAYQPDLVLIGFFAANDVKGNLLPPNRFTLVGGYLYDKQAYEHAVQTRRQQPGQLPIPFKDTLWAHSHAYRFFADRYHRWLVASGRRTQPVESPSPAPTPVPVASPAPPPTPGIDREVFEVTERLLLETAETARRHQAAVALVLIPDIKQVNNPNGQWRATWEELTTFAAAHHIPVIDLAPAFLDANQAGQTPTLWFMTNKHWTAAGHRLAATLIYRALVQQRVIPAVNRERASG